MNRIIFSNRNSYFLFFVVCVVIAAACKWSHGASLPINNLPVFPGAAGFGTTTPAGRGGKIVKVTNLNDSGAGSLRSAISLTMPRIIVFEVSGTIILSANLVISNPYITIAGQTAPSPGITLRRGTLTVASHDVLVQHLRIRVGDDPGGPDPTNRDGIQILSPSYNVVIDHISASWAIDENGSTWDVSDVTISNSIFSEGLNNSLHHKGPHSKGFLIGDKSKRITFSRNLLANNVERHPLIKAGSSVLLLNNLIYNPAVTDYVAIGIDDEGHGPAYLSAVGNVFISGRDTPTRTGKSCYAFVVGGKTAAGTQFYLKDNYHPNGPTWRGPAVMKVDYHPPDTWLPSVKIINSGAVESLVLANAGARPADRDTVDKRVVNMVKTRTGSIINTPGQVGGWPQLQKNYRVFPVPANPNEDSDGDGYTNIEKTLHQKAAEVEGR
jgi:pectate lyase